MGTIYLAGGCFWGLQKFFDQFSGVIRTEVGYANGPDKAPSYQEVCRNSTGIYYTDEAQLPVIRKVYERQQDEVGKPLAVAIEPIRNFFSAEEYHQKYLDKNPGGYCHIPRSYFSLADK